MFFQGILKQLKINLTLPQNPNQILQKSLCLSHGTNSNCTQPYYREQIYYIKTKQTKRCTY